MEALGEKVLNGLGSIDRDRSFYRASHVGNFLAEDDHFWVAFGHVGPKFGNWAHQTVSLYDYGLDVFANVELLPAVKKLRRKVRGDQRKFLEIISGLPEPFTVRIEERRKRQAQQYDYFPIAELKGQTSTRYGEFGLKVNDLESASFRCLLRFLLKEEEIKYPYLSVRKTIARKHILELSERNVDALVKEVICIMKAFHPLVKFVNG
jgi:hypothetical protein